MLTQCKNCEPLCLVDVTDLGLVLFCSGGLVFFPRRWAPTTTQPSSAAVNVKSSFSTLDSM